MSHWQFRQSKPNKIYRKPGTTPRDEIFEALREEEALCADLRRAMKRRQLTEMRAALAASYKDNAQYKAKVRQPAATLRVTLDDLASFPNGLQAMNWTDQLLAINATSREEWSIDGDLDRYQKNLCTKNSTNSTRSGECLPSA